LTVNRQPIDPERATRYVRQPFGPALAEVQASMEALAQAYSPEILTAQAYAQYEQFRPDIPEGQNGWGAGGHAVTGYHLGNMIGEGVAEALVNDTCGVAIC
jgi:hypothetical protein